MYKTKEKDNGITLIVLVITIIVVLILAGVTIQTLTGDNGLLQKTGEATEKNSIGTEKEQIALAATTVSMDDEKDIEQREEMFQNQLDKYTGENKTRVYASSSSYTIHFIETNRVYTIDDNGEIREEDASIVKEDEVAGAFDGTGSENDPYIIMSIEDLVYLANQVNNGINNYNNKWVALGKPLDFKSKLSYKDINTKYSYDEARKSYIPNENSENTLMELCTTGEGFTPINGFNGKFNGKNYTINNLYENRSGYCGLFATYGGYYIEAWIKNLTISGEIISTDNYAAGFVGLPLGITIENCTNNVNVQGVQAGGFAGYYRYGSDQNFINCINNGNIKATNKAGGIIGYSYHGKNFTNCINNGKIEGDYAGGIVRLG